MTVSVQLDVKHKRQQGEKLVLAQNKLHLKDDYM